MSQSVILKVIAGGVCARRTKVIKVVILDVLARAKRGITGIGLPQRDSTSSVYIWETARLLSKRYPESVLLVPSSRTRLP